MKTTVKNQKNEVKTYRYFAGESLQDLLFNVTQIMTVYSEEGTDPRVKIIPVHPAPYKLWWEFYLDDIKICTVHYEAQDTDGYSNLGWLVWHNNIDGLCFEDIYESEIGFPDWVETLEEEEEFFNRELV